MRHPCLSCVDVGADEDRNNPTCDGCRKKTDFVQGQGLFPRVSETDGSPWNVDEAEAVDAPEEAPVVVTNWQVWNGRDRAVSVNWKEREAELRGMFGRGATNREIAEHFGCSEGAVAVKLSDLRLLRGRRGSNSAAERCGVTLLQPGIHLEPSISELSVKIINQMRLIEDRQREIEAMWEDLRDMLIAWEKEQKAKIEGKNA